jgi:hypothetical protein
MDEKIDVGPELYRLKEIYENNLGPLGTESKMNLNTLIYYFEKFLDSHRRYEETKLELLKLNSKLRELGDENELEED